MKKHYDNDPLKHWLHCDLGCKDANFKSCTAFFCHIAWHTKDYPFKCVIPMNNSRTKCTFAATTKSNMKQHFDAQHDVESSSDESCTSSSSQSESDESESESESVSDSQSESIDNNCNNFDINALQIEFENSGYYVSVDCHICQQHLTDYVEYKIHLQTHYAKDKNRNWLTCDYGCKELVGGVQRLKVFTDARGFLCHIASHTMDYPFRCNGMVNGKKCTVGRGTKGNLKKHWMNNHGMKKDRNRLVESDSESDDEMNSDDSESSYESSSSNDESESEFGNKKRILRGKS
eukprot:161071_1